MQILDNGRVAYGLDEIPMEVLFKDLSYQIISSKDNKKLLPLLRHALSKEVKFILGSGFMDELEGNDITYYIDDGLQLLIDAVCLKFIKHVKQNAKGGDSRLADCENYWKKVFSYSEYDKSSFYEPDPGEEDDDPEDAFEDEYYENIILAESFLWDVVHPSLEFLLDKYCDKHYHVIVTESRNKIYDVVNIPLDGMTSNEINDLLKNEEYGESSNITVKKEFKGYTKRKKDASRKNNETALDTDAEEPESEG